MQMQPKGDLVTSSEEGPKARTSRARLCVMVRTPSLRRKTATQRPRGRRVA